MNLLTQHSDPEHDGGPVEVTLTVTFYAGSIDIAGHINDTVVSMIGTANIAPPAKQPDPWAVPSRPRTSPVDQFDRRAPSRARAGLQELLDDVPEPSSWQVLGTCETDGHGTHTHKRVKTCVDFRPTQQ